MMSRFAGLNTAILIAVVRLGVLFGVVVPIDARADCGKAAGFRDRPPHRRAWINWIHESTGTTGSATTDDLGAYNLPELSPGKYRIRTVAENYQAQELQELVLAVAGVLELDFRLRPLHDVWEQGSTRSIFLPGNRTILNFFGPDVDSTKSAVFEGQHGRTGSLEATVSDVVDPVLISDLPYNPKAEFLLYADTPSNPDAAITLMFETFLAAVSDDGSTYTLVAGFSWQWSNPASGLGGTPRTFCSSQAMR